MSHGRCQCRRTNAAPLAAGPTRSQATAAVAVAATTHRTVLLAGSTGLRRCRNGAPQLGMRLSSCRKRRRRSRSSAYAAVRSARHASAYEQHWWQSRRGQTSLVSSVPGQPERRPLVTAVGPSPPLPLPLVASNPQQYGSVRFVAVGVAVVLCTATMDVLQPPMQGCERLPVSGVRRIPRRGTHNTSTEVGATSKAASRSSRASCQRVARTASAQSATDIGTTSTATSVPAHDCSSSALGCRQQRGHLAGTCSR